LLKIKIRAEDREDRQKMIDEIVDITQAHLIQVIGNVMVIYRAFDKEPQIILSFRSIRKLKSGASTPIKTSGLLVEK
jgi:hypothetical protein